MTLMVLFGGKDYNLMTNGHLKVEKVLMFAKLIRVLNVIFFSYA